MRSSVSPGGRVAAAATPGPTESAAHAATAHGEQEGDARTASSATRASPMVGGSAGQDDHSRYECSKSDTLFPNCWMTGLNRKCAATSETVSVLKNP